MSRRQQYKAVLDLLRNYDDNVIYCGDDFDYCIFCGKKQIYPQRETTHISICPWLRLKEAFGMGPQRATPASVPQIKAQVKQATEQIADCNPVGHHQFFELIDALDIKTYSSNPNEIKDLGLKAIKDLKETIWILEERIKNQRTEINNRLTEITSCQLSLSARRNVFKENKELKDKLREVTNVYNKLRQNIINLSVEMPCVNDENRILEYLIDAKPNNGKIEFSVEELQNLRDACQKKPPLTLEEARLARRCRICGKPDKLIDGKPFKLDYGKEYAHSQCVALEKF